MKKTYLPLFIAAATSLFATPSLYVPSGTVGSSSNGNVGIGTSTPSELLEVDGRIKSTSDIYNAFTGPLGNVRVGFLNAGGASNPDTYFGMFYDTTNNVGVISALTGGVAWRGLSLAPNGGNVGVGIPNPMVKLDLANASYIGIRPQLGTYIPSSWQRGNAGGIIFSASANSDGSGWSWGSRLINNDYGNGDALSFDVNAGGAWTNDVLVISGRSGALGNVGIGTNNPTQKLSVNGAVRAKEVIVDTSWSDYVFEPGYRLAPLSEVAESIKREGHLPGIPSAKDVAEKGIGVGETQAMLLAKIEELTLHQIELEKRLDAQEKVLVVLRATKAK